MQVQERTKRCASSAQIITLALLLAASARESTAVNFWQLGGPDVGPGWVKFDTDDCGSLGRVEDRSTVLNMRGNADDAIDDGDDDDDEDYSWTRIWGIPDQDSPDAQVWFSEHPEVAIVTDAVERSCDGDLDEVEVTDSAEVA